MDSYFYIFLIVLNPMFLNYDAHLDVYYEKWNESASAEVHSLLLQHVIKVIVESHESIKIICVPGTSICSIYPF